MVDPETPERRNECEYSLDAIHRLAGYKQVEYRGKKVRRDIANLGFQIADVCQCLGSLQPHHFAHSLRYHNVPRWHDVYRIRHASENGVTYELYIKLRLSRDYVVIELCSFHT